MSALHRFGSIFLIYFVLSGCSAVSHDRSTLLKSSDAQTVSITPQFAASPSFTPSATPVPSATATATRIPSPSPTPAPLIAVKEENGWVTYRNEIVGYEISVPDNYVIRGGLPSIGSNLLGPAVPDEEIFNLISRYYGDSLIVWMGERDSSDQFEPWIIGIYAYDIIVKNLGGAVSPGGVGDYQLTKRQETLQIDGQSYPVTFTVEQKNNKPVGELAVLSLEKDGIQLMFGYSQTEDDPEAYQTYRKEIWPVVRRIIESYKYLSKNN